ncbi:S8 family serine peptidase [Streptomyces caelestis]|uniref:S8 family serine peptidase n=1 Tax=Streptomyces TaxID=1883 RepID=UPI0006AE80EA|nr:S8 family serine peptidase [Streptomyces sp. XY152]KOV23780.1 serine protease [Streptomyces sp. XY152]
MSAVVSALVTASVAFAPGATAADVQSEQWYLEPMQTEQMWKTSTGKGIKVAVIDSGVNPRTDSLKGQVLADEVPENVAYGATDDYDGHGTTMAELIAGTGANGGIQGLAPGAKIVPYRVSFETQPDGEDKQKTATTLEALRAVAKTDAQIVSMSFGSSIANPEIEAAIKHVASKGKLLIAAVGNDGEEFIGYPAAYPYVLGVSSIDESSRVSDFSSYGHYVDLVAPGENIPSYCRPDFSTYCHDNQGTSQATAITAASAALIWSAHPDWTANQVTRALIDTAGRKWPKDKPTQKSGYGTIRPRVVLADPDYDAGDPYSDPLGKWNKKEGEELVTEINPASPSPSATGTSQGAGSTSADKAAGAGSKTETVSAESSNDSNTLWIALGAAAAVIVIGGVTFGVLRARRAR